MYEDVFVIGTNGEERSGLWGELLTGRGAWGTCRGHRLLGSRCSSDECNELWLLLPWFLAVESAGCCYPTAVNVPITCGGVLVQPGDFILADIDGVAVIPAANRQEVFAKASIKLAGENTVRDELAAGRSPRAVFDQYGVL